jgi:hypothetical protein
MEKNNLIIIKIIKEIYYLFYYCVNIKAIIEKVNRINVFF